MTRLYHLLGKDSTIPCGLVSFDIAFLLLEREQKPTILHLRSETDSVLFPDRYGGTVNWGGHMVCSCDGLIFDPLVNSHPFSCLKSYASEAFPTQAIGICNVTATAYIRERWLENPEIYFDEQRLG